MSEKKRATAEFSNRQDATSPSDPKRWIEELRSEAERRTERWSFLIGLPPLNAGLLGVGSLLFVLGVVRLTLPPIYSGAAAAVRPYSASGRAETCQSHLRSLAEAMALYTQDSDGHYPVMDNGGSGTARFTWVSAIKDRTDSGNFVCPNQKGGDGLTTSGYGLNPILAGGTDGPGQGDVKNPAQTILLADRAEQHDLALLPALAGWAAAGSTEQAIGNIDFRHGGQAVLLYADGHAEAKGSDKWLSERDFWGGALAVRRSQAHLLSRYPVLQQAQAALDKGDTKAVTALFQTNRAGCKEALGQVFALWQQNGGGSDEAGSMTVEKWGWSLAQLWRDSGEAGMLHEMDGEQSARSQGVLQAANASPWQKYRGELGFGLECPAGWTASVETDGRYRNTFIRSASPYIFALVERGERSTMGPESGIAWEGMESDYRRTYGSGYKRIRMGNTTLAGEFASLWEFELEKPGEPRLRKLYIGRSHAWSSFVLVFATPAADWVSWQPEQAKLASSFRS